MLRLERMEVQGFKSFLDRASVEFPGGITAVVGPNGCGKSNIADAIQWALGEQSARALRGSRMEDLIFAGTDARDPGGLAEVHLHLVSSDGDLPDGRKKVVLTRRLFRTGESDYLIDGKKSRLVDIRSLLEKIRAGQRTYAVVDQSHVAGFVTSKPKDRRLFIEEAAGISGYRQRRRLAEQRLEATRANLLRVEDILLEIERQLRSLKRQAGAARRARRLDEALKAMRTIWYRKHYFASARWLSDHEEAKSVHSRETEHLDRERRRLAERLAEARERLEACHRERDEAVARSHEATLDEARVEQDLEATKARIEALTAEMERWDRQGRRLSEDREARREELTRLQTSRKAAKESLDEVAARLEEARRASEAAQARFRQMRESVAQQEKVQHEALQARAGLSARLSAAEEASTREAARAEEAAGAGHRLEASRAEHQAAVEEAEKDAEEKAARIEEEMRAAREAREKEERASLDLEARRAQESERAAELGKKAGELAALESLDVRLAGEDGALEVMQHARAGALTIRGLVADALETDEEIERAAEAYLRHLLPAVLVDSTEEVLRGAQLGIKGRISFLPLRARAGGESTREDEMPEALRTDPRVQGRLVPRLRDHSGRSSAITGRIADAVLVESLNAALDLHERFPSYNYVTEQGHIVAASGLVTIEGGQGQRKDGLLARARRRERLAEEVAEVEVQRAEAVRRVAEGREVLRAAQQARRSAEEAVAEARRAFALAKVAVDRARQELKRVDRETALTVTVREAAIQGAAKAREQARELEREVRVAEERAAAARERVESMRGELLASESAVHDKASVQGAVQSEVRALEERDHSLARECERLAREISTIEGQHRDGRQAFEEAGKEIGELKAKCVRLDAELQEIHSRRVLTTGAVGEFSDVLEARTEAVRHLETRLGNMTEEWEAARARREQVALDVERARADLEHLLEDCRKELGARPDELPETVESEHLEGIEDDESLLFERISEFQKKREKIGPVNSLAEAEFDELHERHEESLAQKKDLADSIEELMASIKKMDRESRERFLEAFSEIRRYFREQFAILFRGGRADIGLEDPDAPLECGIEIFCQPPGKKLQTVNLLSGGEKALAATAVLFAIFRYQPPPFCLLDEVDAPLDESNVARFAESIRAFSEKTQFILITHNKRSMEMADLLYGVTMPEPGISRLVSMTMD